MIGANEIFLSFGTLGKRAESFSALNAQNFLDMLRIVKRLCEHERHRGESHKLIHEETSPELVRVLAGTCLMRESNVSEH